MTSCSLQSRIQSLPCVFQRCRPITRVLTQEGAYQIEGLQCFLTPRPCISVRLRYPVTYAYQAFNGIRNNPIQMHSFAKRCFWS